MPTPEEIHARVPLSEAAAESVLAGRRTLERILDGSDPRVFVVVGPCSIHDPVAGLDYARRLKKLADEVAGTLLLVMRVYFEKPRTATGWKGYINDPRMDDSFHIEANGFRLLGIELDDVAVIETLPHHRDPFDRLLVAQAKSRKLPVVSSDRAFSDYGVKRIW